MIAALLAVTLFISAGTWNCRDADSLRMEEEKAGGLVTKLDGQLAMQLAIVIWRSGGIAPPEELDSLLVVARKDGTVSLIPVIRKQACVSPIRTTESQFINLLNQIRRQLDAQPNAR